MRKSLGNAFEVIKICSILPRGQANVEGGFSTNKYTIRGNMEEDTVIIALRYVMDFIHVGNDNVIIKFEITKQL